MSEPVARPTDAVRAAYERLRALADPAIFVSLRPEADALTRAVALEAEGPRGRPLYGWIVAVKDNLDTAGLPTTAACPPFAYVPARSAHAVERLEEAGAIVIGKTNLDQFATGLAGTRSPYGVPRNPLDATLVPGGSSSGSAVAVAQRIVRAALGSDTAGSGRVPAACTGTVGVKPTVGRVGTRGLVPAVPALDCVSVHARTVADARLVRRVLDAADRDDPDPPLAPPPGPIPRIMRVGVLPGAGDGLDEAPAAAYRTACDHLAATGVSVTEVDPAPFTAAGATVYSPACLAARVAAFGDVLARHPQAADPTVAAVLRSADVANAVDVHRMEATLTEARREAARVFTTVDALLVPTVPWVPTLAAERDDPIGTTERLGRFTTFVNPLRCGALSVPVGTRPGESVTIVAPPGTDEAAAELAELLAAAPDRRPVLVAVTGAHLTGQPLHPELAGCGAVFVGPVRTAPRYRLLALTDHEPARAGLLRVPSGGVRIDAELYRLDPPGLGRLVAGVPPPLCIGTVELEDGTTAAGFLCEPHAAARAHDVSRFGGWRSYLATTREQQPA